MGPYQSGLWPVPSARFQVKWHREALYPVGHVPCFGANITLPQPVLLYRPSCTTMEVCHFRKPRSGTTVPYTGVKTICRTCYRRMQFLHNSLSFKRGVYILLVGLILTVQNWSPCCIYGWHPLSTTQDPSPFVSMGGILLLPPRTPVAMLYRSICVILYTCICVVRQRSHRGVRVSVSTFSGAFADHFINCAICSLSPGLLPAA